MKKLWSVIWTIVVGLAIGVSAAAASETVWIDDFEEYTSDAALQAVYTTHPDGNRMIVYIDTEHVYEGSQSMRYEYIIGTPDWGGVQRQLPWVSWEGARGIQFWLVPDGSDRSLTIQFGQATGEYWEAYVPFMGRTEPLLVRLPFEAFVRPSWNTGGSDEVDLQAITSFSIYIGGGSGPGSGTFYIDSVALFY